MPGTSHTLVGWSFLFSGGENLVSVRAGDFLEGTKTMVSAIRASTLSLRGELLTPESKHCLVIIFELLRIEPRV